MAWPRRMSCFSSAPKARRSTPPSPRRAAEALIGRDALSALAADPARAGILHAASNPVHGRQAAIHTTTTTITPARITAKLAIPCGDDAAHKLDIEGPAPDGKGGFWLASEGRSDRLIPHAICRVDDKGGIEQEIALPEALPPNEIRFGFEGITVAGHWLWMAVQREWKDDPKGMVKRPACDTAEETRGGVHYPPDTPGEGACVGLSEITLHGDWVDIVERDNQVAGRAATRKLYRAPAAKMVPADLDTILPGTTLPDARLCCDHFTTLEGATLSASATLRTVSPASSRAIARFRISIERGFAMQAGLHAQHQC